MPLIEPSAYRPPPLFSSAHLQTVWQSTIRRVAVPRGCRERLETSDGDFLDLDWFRTAGAPSAPAVGRLVMIVHGMESSPRENYMRGMIKALLRRGWDVVALNLRGCSGVPNRFLRSYHAGISEDVAAAVDHALAAGAYERFALVGFSLGGNLVLKYLGEQADAACGRVSAAAAVSTPCDLVSSSRLLAEPHNAVYMRRFMRKFRRKYLEKRRLLSDPPRDLAALRSMRSFKDLDEHFTAPLWGFATAEEYWRLCSSRTLLPQVRVRTLILNAADDPFLAPECFPREEAAASDWVYLEAPAHGGHCAFLEFGRGEYWAERRVAEFLEGEDHG